MVLSIFNFVRDKITFTMCENDRAFQTLEKRYGDCDIKTNLQVALLRAINIPVRYYIASLRKEWLKGIILESFYELGSVVIPHHPWCECYLSEKRIACDTLLDKELAENINRKGIHTKDDIPTIDWDGKHDLNTMKKWIIEDKGTLASIDKLFPEAQKWLDDIPIEKDQLEILINQSNKYTENLRKLKSTNC